MPSSNHIQCQAANFEYYNHNGVSNHNQGDGLRYPYPIEHQAYENMTIDDDTYWTSDWGNPGKQHATNKQYDN